MTLKTTDPAFHCRVCKQPMPANWPSSVCSEVCLRISSGHWQESGEGPFADQRSAMEFGQAEVGVFWVVAQDADEKWHVLVTTQGTTP